MFVMVCETHPLPVYPIVFRNPGLPVGGKHSVFNCIHHHVRSFLLVLLKGWLTGFFLGLIVFMGCSLACVHAWFF